MTYGISILNSNGRTQIDENFSSFYTTTSAPISVATTALFTYPPSDIIAARPATGTTGDRFAVTFSTSETTFDPTGVTYHWGGTGDSNSTFERTPRVPYPVTNGYKYYALRQFSGNVNANSGYGLGVYSGTGQTLFNSTTLDKNLEVVAVGTLNSSTYNFVLMGTTWANSPDLSNTVYFPSSTGSVTDLDKYYCVINTAYSALYEVPIDGFSTIYQHFGNIYEYIWTGPNTGRIRINSFQKDTGAWAAFGNFVYIILKEI
jgi:hypothetical protein